MAIQFETSMPNFRRTISARRLNHIQKSQSVEEATKMGLWDSFIDMFFYGKCKKNACTALYSLLKNQVTEDIDEASEKVAAFNQLTQLTDASHVDYFSMEIERITGADKYNISFSAKGFEAFSPQVTFSLPATESDHTKEQARSDLAKCAGCLLKLKKAELSTQDGRGLHKDCLTWNHFLEEKRLNAQRQAFTLSKQIDSDYEFDRDSLLGALPDTPPESIPDQLFEDWVGIPGINCDSPQTSAQTPSSSSFHAAETTEGHYNVYNLKRASAGNENTAEAEQAAKYESAAIKIQKGYRDFRKRRKTKQQQAVKQNRTDEFIQMRSSSRSGRDGSVYLIDPLNKLPPVKKLMPAANKPDVEIRGRVKKLAADDGSYITLSPTGEDAYNKRDDFTAQRNARTRRLWTDIEAALGDSMEYGCAFAPGLLGVADDGLIHAASGGMTVFGYMQDVGNLPITVFKQACADLSKLHKKNIFLRDIKNENFLVKVSVKNANGKVIKTKPENLSAKFIDLDEVLTPDYGDRKNITFTPDVTTACLMHLRLNSNEQKYLRAADNYAMIISMFEANVEPGTELNLTQKNGNLFSLGLLSDAEQKTKNFFLDFIDTHVKTEYIELITNFMENPVDYALPEEIGVFDLFKWS